MKQMDVSIVRDTIPIETVYGKMMEDGIANVQITSFSENTTTELVTILNDLKNQGMKGLSFRFKTKSRWTLESSH